MSYLIFFYLIVGMGVAFYDASSTKKKSGMRPGYQYLFFVTIMWPLYDFKGRLY